MNASFLQRYGPWAVVTGASDGIGEAFAQRLAARGINLVLVARRADRLSALAQRLQRECNVQATFVAADLGTEEGRHALEVETQSLDVGLLVASAGFGTSGPLLNADLSEEEAMLRLNCLAVLEQCVTFGNRMKQRGRGGIILLSSLVGWQGTPSAAHYAATKAYIQALAEGIRPELRPLGIDVLAAAPGPVQSGFAARAKMSMSLAAKPVEVAEASLRALGKSGTVVPGALSKFLTYSLAPLPRFLRSRIMGQVMSSMVR